MKPLLLTVFLFVAASMLTHAQTDPSFKDDTTVLSQQLIREKFKTQIAKEQKSQADIKKQQADTVKADSNADLKTEIERIKALQGVIGTPSLSALSGNVTISAGTVSLAETRALAYKALDTLLGQFVTDMKSSTTTTNSTTACAGMPCSETATILIYNPAYFEALPDYQALINELNLLKKNYVQQNKQVEDIGKQGVLAALTVGSSVIKSLIDVASLFKADRTININNEIMDEETLVSKIRKLDDCCARKYYYPTLFSPTSTSSALTTLLAGIDSIRIHTNEIIVTAKAKIPVDYKKAKANADQTKFPTKKDKEAFLATIEKSRTDKEGKISDVEAKIKVLNDRFDGINKELSTTIDGTTKMSLLRNLLRVEGVLEKLKGGAYTLKITAEGKGTNVITKFLWITTIRNSAFVEARFQLFDSQAVLVKANAVYQYASLKKSADILK